MEGERTRFECVGAADWAIGSRLGNPIYFTFFCISPTLLEYPVSMGSIQVERKSHCALGVATTVPPPFDLMLQLTGGCARELL